MDRRLRFLVESLVKRAGIRKLEDWELQFSKDLVEKINKEVTDKEIKKISDILNQVLEENEKNEEEDHEEEDYEEEDLEELDLDMEEELEVKNNKNNKKREKEEFIDEDLEEVFNKGAF